MPKISANVASLKTSLKTLDSKKVEIEQIKNKKLKALAESIASAKYVGTGCATKRVLAKTVSKDALEAAVAKVAVELQKADTNHDDNLTLSEMKSLSKRAAAALGQEYPIEARPRRNVRTGC